MDLGLTGRTAFPMRLRYSFWSSFREYTLDAAVAQELPDGLWEIGNVRHGPAGSTSRRSGSRLSRAPARPSGVRTSGHRRPAWGPREGPAVDGSIDQGVDLGGQNAAGPANGEVVAQSIDSCHSTGPRVWRERLVPCWWARVTAESIETSQLISTSASARVSRAPRTVSQVPSLNRANPATGFRPGIGR